MTQYNKPLPEVDEETQPFWDGAKRHELVIQKCLNCGAYYYPVTHCYKCDSPEMDWVKVSGKGVVHTYTIMYQRYHPGFADEIPYNVAIIRLAEGPFLLSTLVDCKNEDIRCEMPVEVVFDNITEEYTLPKFRAIKE